MLYLVKTLLYILNWSFGVTIMFCCKLLVVNQIAAIRHMLELACPCDVMMGYMLPYKGQCIKCEAHSSKLVLWSANLLY